MPLLDASIAQKIVDEYLPRIRWMLQLQDWTIFVHWKTLPDGVEARVRPNPGYQKAIIEVDIGQIETEEQMKENLFHEMLHILHADLETFRKAAFQHVDGFTGENALDEMWFVGMEHLVRRLENVFSHGLRLTLDQALIQSEDKSKPSFEPEAENEDL